MLLQMAPVVSVTDGQPVILLGLIPALAIQMLFDFLSDKRRDELDAAENALPTLKLEPQEQAFVKSQWSHLKIGQIVKVCNGERFPADLILLKSSNQNGSAYVET